MSLSFKQKAFIDQFLIDRNATQAAIRAGYSKKTARQMGSENLSKPDILNEIKDRTAALTMTAEEVLTRQTSIARGDMGDFLDIGPMGFVVDLNKAKELGLTHLIKKVKQRTTITTTKEAETETHDMEIELYDAAAAQVTIGKFHKLFADRTEVTGANGGPIEVNDARDAILRKLAGIAAAGSSETISEQPDGD